MNPRNLADGLFFASISLAALLGFGILTTGWRPLASSKNSGKRLQHTLGEIGRRQGPFEELSDKADRIRGKVDSIEVRSNSARSISIHGLTMSKITLTSIENRENSTEYDSDYLGVAKLKIRIG